MGSLVGGVYLLVFQMWIVFLFLMLCFFVCSFRKSKKYLTAGGTVFLGVSTFWKKLFINCCSVFCGVGRVSIVWSFGFFIYRFVVYFDGQQASQVDFGDGFGAFFFFYIVAFRFVFVYFVCGSYQVLYSVFFFQEGVVCREGALRDLRRFGSFFEMVIQGGRWFTLIVRVRRVRVGGRDLRFSGRFCWLFFGCWEIFIFDRRRVASFRIWNMVMRWVLFIISGRDLFFRLVLYLRCSVLGC